MLAHKQKIGKLDRRITFQKKVSADNVSNEDTEEGWEDLENDPTVYGSKDENAGSESYEADKLTGAQGVSFVCRYRTDLDIEMRIKLEDVYYEIISISEVGRKRFLEIKTTTGQQFRG